MKDASRMIGDRRFWVRAWWPWGYPYGAWRPFRDLWYLLWQLWDSRYDDGRRAECWTRTRTRQNWRCYCPVGSITEFHLCWLGFGVWFEVQRGGPVTPCHCDKIIWLMFPENHAENIEDYPGGLAALQAEYPDVKE